MEPLLKKYYQPNTSSKKSNITSRTLPREQAGQCVLSHNLEKFLKISYETRTSIKKPEFSGIYALKRGLHSILLMSYTFFYNWCIEPVTFCNS